MLFTVTRGPCLSLPSANLIEFWGRVSQDGVCDYMGAVAWTQFRSGLNFNFNYQGCSFSVVLAFSVPKILWVVSRL
jgi:hypothetical protein